MSKKTGMKTKRSVTHRLEGFRALMDSDKSGGYFMEDVDGSHRLWTELSAEAKLEQIAGNAAYYERVREFVRVSAWLLGFRWALAFSASAQTSAHYPPQLTPRCSYAAKS